MNGLKVQRESLQGQILAELYQIINYPAIVCVNPVSEALVRLLPIEPAAFLLELQDIVTHNFIPANLQVNI